MSIPDTASLNMQEYLKLFPDLATSEGHIAGLVELSKRALDRDDLLEALRLTDRAVRLSKDNYHLQILRGTVLLKGNLPLQAIVHFKHAIAVGGDAEGQIGLAHAHLALGDIQAAVDLVTSLIGGFSCEDFTMIAPLANRVCKTGENPRAGWVSLSADGRLIGAVDEIRLKDGAAVIATCTSTDQVIATLSSDEILRRISGAELDGGFLTFEIDPKLSHYDGPIRVTLADADLVGSPVTAPLPARIQGFVDRVDGRIFGWVGLAGHPSAKLNIRLIDQTGIHRELTSDECTVTDDDLSRSPESVDRQRFSINLAPLGLEDSRVEIFGWLPAFQIGNQLSGSPIGGEFRRSGSVAERPLSRESNAAITVQRPVDIIIPVYDGGAETLACLRSVIAANLSQGISGQDCEIIVIDDASPDDELVKSLSALASGGQISLFRNERNLGFPISVNRGFDLHSDRDVVVLNSDTLVFSDWLTRLRTAAYSAPDIATVTPFSNEASILSYPMRLGDNPPPSAAEGEWLDQAASRVNDRITVDIPTAVGFCMYIRRDCLAEIGNFDISAFGRGYGEENDLCMRAQEAGWRNIAAPNIFVTHLGGRSFGTSKALLVARNTRILNIRHPGYDALVRDFIKADPLAPARRNLDIARLRHSISGPAILLVTLGLAGGVARNVKESAERHTASGLTPLILRPIDYAIGAAQGKAALVDPFDDSLCNLAFDLPHELDLFLWLLSECKVSRLEIHHFLGLDPSIFGIAARLSVPYDIMLHDYSWVCPRINLLNGRGRYCGLPLDAQICDRCVAIDGATIKEDISVAELRSRSAEILSGAAQVVGACEDIVDRLSRIAPRAAYKVSAWEDEPSFEQAAAPQLADHQIRVAIIGGIGEQKGYDLLLACARDAALRDLPIEFVVIGYTSDDLRLFKTGRVFVTGRYDDSEAVALIRTQHCHFAFLPSVSPETWSYTLTLAWKAGLEVLAFDFGAIAERIRSTGHGRVIPFSFDEKVINLAIENFAKSLSAGVDDSRIVDTGAIGIVNNERGVGVPVISITIADKDDSSPLETLIDLEPGLYAFSLSDLPADTHAVLPVVQISAVAGYAADAGIDFFGKHDPVENLLTNTSDVVVVRISGSAGSLLIRTLRLPSGDASKVSVQYHRLDRRGAAAELAAEQNNHPSLRTQITAHIQNRGDLPFVGPGWAGCIEEGLWIEAFAINPLKGFIPGDIEYKALTGSGFETPWVSGGMMCGTRGTSNPLVAFAIRLRGAAAERYECRYSGTFLGSGVIGPFRNGAACKSAYGRDPVIGIELEINEIAKDVADTDTGSSEPSLPEYEVVYGSY